MLKAYFQKLFKYNEWANQNTLNAVEKAGQQSEEIVKLLSHIVAAQEVWLARVLNTDSQNQPIWPEYSLEEIKEKLPESSEEWSEFVETMNDDHFKEEHQYTNSKGDLYKSTMEDVILHIVNHSTHHRAQISKLLREQGEEPPVTDYIFFSREKKE